MKKTLMIASMFALLTTPAFSQENQDDAEPVAPPTAEEVDAAVKTINGLADAAQTVNAFCEVTAGEADIKEGDTAAEDAYLQKLDAFIDTLDEDAQLAFDINETVEAGSPAAKKLDAAFAKLDEQCNSDEPEEGEGTEPEEGANTQ